ncbi:family 16 glycosylhydrolase [Jannaschia sp. KMU-145]|uniref:family 16 glycosylhydrolase n=1 Tax=Jannaschia halovivens TaxID=3388667 RepID=UPI00396B24A9
MPTPRSASLALCLLLPATAGAQGAFFEPFDDLDRARWFVSDGWSNGPHQNCIWSANQVAVADGQLRLRMSAEARDAFDLSCAELQSNARYGYGAFEARMRVPYAGGMNANFFTFIGAPQDRPHNEIDFEFLARDAPVLQTNFHTARSSANEALHPMQDDATVRTYAFIWEPGRIRWFIDGVLIREATDATLPDEPQKIYASIWSTDRLTDWMGRFDPASAPKVLKVDWIAYTPLGDGCRFPESILCVDGVAEN